MTSIRIEVSIAALVLLFLILFSLRRNFMSIKSSVTWLLLPLLFIVVAIFPDPLEQFAHILGFETLSNFIFVIIIALLLIICFFLTATISRQGNQITKLIQELSILKHGESKNDKSKK